MVLIQVWQSQSRRQCFHCNGAVAVLLGLDIITVCVLEEQTVRMFLQVVGETAAAVCFFPDA